jgi:hypothetical protein
MLGERLSSLFFVFNYETALLLWGSKFEPPCSVVKNSAPTPTKQTSKQRIRCRCSRQWKKLGFKV